MELSEIGEFGLIERIQRITGPVSAPLIIGIGDDAAVLSLDPVDQLLLSTDAMVEGRHFLRHWMSPYQIGQRAAAAALSDIAAMGGCPIVLLSSLCLSPIWSVEEIEELVRGMHDLARRFEVSLAGGDTVSGMPAGNRCHTNLVIDMVAVGRARAEHLWLRQAARVGDRILVTGTLGGASAAIAMYEASLPTQLQRFRLLLERLTSPIPRFDVASALAPMMVVHAAIDISDGLLQDAGHVAKASGVRMELQAAALPVDKQLLDCATLLDANPLHWAAAGGEDFELLLTTPPEQVPQMQAAVAEIGVSLTDIGEVVEGEGVVLLDEADEQLHVPTHGWDHLRN